MSWWWIILLLWLAPAILVAIAMLWTVRHAKASSDGSFSEPAMHESQMPELTDELEDTRPVEAKSKAAGRRTA